MAPVEMLRRLLVNFKLGESGASGLYLMVD